jgi:hypothetical protein
MSAHGNQNIDWEIARLSGGLFPRSARLSSVPLITVPMEWTSEIPEPVPAPATKSEVSRPPPLLASITLPSMELEGRPSDPGSLRRKAVPFLAAGLTAGILLGSICAMAFSPTPAAPPRRATETQEVNPQAIAAAGPGLPGGLPEPTVDTPTTAAQAMGPAAVAAAATRKLQAQPILASAPARTAAGRVDAFAARPADIDRSAAAVAIAAAGRSAAACLSPDDPRGAMPVSVTFATSGRVTTARIEGGPFAGTEVGGCIARTLRSARVGGFEGSPVTIHGAIHLR